MVSKPTSRRSYVALFAPLIALALMAALSRTEFVRQWENVTMDWRFRARADTDPPPDQRIALVGIGDGSLKATGRWEEWTRATHAQFTSALTYRPPSVLAFDFFFPDQSREPENDTLFAYALALHPGAITGMAIDVGSQEADPPYLGNTRPLTTVVGDRSKLLGGGKANVPIPVIAESSWTAVVNCPPSSDGMRRFLPIIGRVGDEVYPSLVLQILMLIEEAGPDDVEVILGQAVRVPRQNGEDWTIPVNERGYMEINYRNTERFRMTEYVSVYFNAMKVANGEPWPDDFPEVENKIVLVGQSALGLPDLGPSPYERSEPLFRVQATGLDSILRGDFLKRPPTPLVYGCWLLLAWLTLFFLRDAPTAFSLGIPLAISTAYLIAAFSVFEAFSLAIPIVLPVVGFGLIHATIFSERLIRETREKKHIHNAFGTYMAKDLVDQIVASGRMPELGGEEVDITIMFSDIQGFSGFSEVLSAKELVELMVEYLSELTDILLDHGGTLDKYIGDAIDSMFGAPIPMEDHAYRAVSCALAYQKKQDELRDNWRKDPSYPKNVHEMRTRIGLNSGEAVVGNIGSRRRLNYAMMGDNVNLAARCETGAKSYGVFTMATEDTRSAAMATKDDIRYRFLDQIVVKGRSLPVKIYEVIDYHRNLSDDTIKGLDLYAKAMETYLSKNWPEAQKRFREAAEHERFQPGRDPGITTNPSLILADRCLAMEMHPPGDDWDGVYTMTTK